MAEHQVQDTKKGEEDHMGYQDAHAGFSQLGHCRRNDAIDPE